MTASQVALIDWDESHVDVPDLDLVLPDNAAGAFEEWGYWRSSAHICREACGDSGTNSVTQSHHDLGTVGRTLVRVLDLAGH